MDECERGYPSLTPDGDTNQQPVLRHAVVVCAHIFNQVSAWVAVTPPINAMAEKLESLCLTMLLLRVQEAFGCYVSLRSARSARGHVGQYQSQVTGAEFGLGVRWRLVLTSAGVPERPLGIPQVVVFNLGRGSVPWGRPVAGQLSGTPQYT